MPRSLSFASVALGLLCATSSCIGNIGDPGTDETEPDPDPQVVCTADMPVEPGPSPVRRMTRFEYNNTVRDLLGDTTGPAKNFGAEEEALGFNNNAANLVVSDQLANKYMIAAEGVSERATDPSMLAANVPCAGNGDPEGCARQFIDSFVTRAFRRPLAQEEKDAFFALFQKGAAEVDEPDPFRIGIELVIQAALQSPAFLYRIEFGQPAEGDKSYVRLSHHEMASRLSYFLWGTMPDPELFAAADAGELGEKEQVEKQARRMLNDPKARDAIGEFHTQWLDYDRIGNITKDAALFPDYSPAIGQMMREEMRAFVEHAVFEEGGDFATLLTAPYSYMPPELASFYGLTPADGAMPGVASKVELDPSQRAGLLTLGALMTINAHTNQTSPVHRGKLVREQFLCFLMPPPPPEVSTIPPPPSAAKTAKERFAMHSSSKGCSDCHRRMDPIGFGFENYDSVGRYRTKESGVAIDATGSVIESDVADFKDAIELVNNMADSQDVQNCYVKQWFRFGYGRSETKGDKCMIGELGTAFDEKGGDIKELLVALTQSDAFLYRRAGGTP